MGGVGETVGTALAGGGMILLSLFWLTVRQWVDAELKAYHRRKRQEKAR